jgi:DHA1 family multidrug resistance protein-like MFS transporter
MTPVLPLIIKEMGNVADVAFTSGLAFSLMGVVSTMSSLVASRIASGNVSLKKMMVWCSLFTGLLYLPPMFAYTLVPFIALMALRGTFNGGINIASSSLIALTVKENEQGMAYGLQQSAQFLGSGIGPMLGGTLAAVVGLRSVFPVSAGLYIVAGLLVFLLLPELKRDKLS